MKWELITDDQTQYKYTLTESLISFISHVFQFSPDNIVYEKKGESLSRLVILSL